MGSLLGQRWLATSTIGLIALLAACAGTSPNSAPPSTPPASPSASAEASPSSTTASVASPSPFADCGTGEAGFTAAAAEAPRSLHLGGSTIPFTTASISLKDGSYDTGDAIPAYIGLSLTLEAVDATPAGSIPLTGDSIVVSGVQVALFDWSGIDFAAGRAQPGAELPGMAAPEADGSAAIVAPRTPGEYAVEIHANWAGRCLAGDGVGYGRIVVQ